MDAARHRPLVFRILASRALWSLVFVALVSLLVVVGSGGLSATVTDRQAQFVADSVRRSAVQCYAVEGSFPSTAAGVAYLRDNYGLSVDEGRYVVYYESLGENLVPQIQVVPLSQEAPLRAAADLLGLSGSHEGER
jgi:hypothetical protein